MCVITGGNIDSGRLSRIIQKGLGVTGRLLRFAVAIPDHRNGLENLAKTIADENAVVKSLVTEQMWLHNDVGTTWVSKKSLDCLKYYSLLVRLRIKLNIRFSGRNERIYGKSKTLKGFFIIKVSSNS